MNYFLLTVVHDLFPDYATDNVLYLGYFIVFSTPQSLSKLSTSIKFDNVKLFNDQTFKLFPKDSHLNLFKID